MPTPGEIIDSIRKQFHVADNITVTAATPLDDLGDSLALVKSVIALEDNYHLQQIPMKTLRHWRTVGDIIQYIQSMVQ